MCMKDRVAILKTFHDNFGHWDKETTRKSVIDCYWWPQMRRVTHNYLKYCDRCQKATTLLPYHTNLNVSLTSLFETYSIDFAGLLPI